MSTHEIDTPTDGETVTVSDRNYTSATSVEDADVRVSIDTGRTSAALDEDEVDTQRVEVWGSDEHAVVDLSAEDDDTHASAAALLDADKARAIADGLEQLAEHLDDTGE